jgi:hypothetical protein
MTLDKQWHETGKIQGEVQAIKLYADGLVV